jgi:hypothetical protein
MKKTTASFAMIALSLFICQMLPAQAIPLNEAIKKGYLALTSFGTGGHEGECLKLKLDNLSWKDLGIIVPAGQIFEAGDSALQNLMISKEETFLVSRGKNRIAKLFGFCVEATDSSPGEGSVFSLGEMAEGNLLKMARYLSDNNLHENQAAQYAVWAVMDEDRLESIGDPVLAKFTADLLGKPLPEYHIAYQQPQDRQSPGRPANLLEAVALNGLFYYELPKDQMVSFGLYSGDGEHLHELFSNRLQKRGQHKFRFEFEIRGLEKGNYVVKLVSEGETIKELAVEL